MRRRNFLTFLLAAALLASPLVAGEGSGAAARQGGNVPSDGVERVTLEDFKALLESGRPVLVLDVRAGITEKVKGAVNIPLGDIEARLAEIPRDREIVTYCA